MNVTPPLTEDPLVVALDMGYGHMRPGHALARLLGTDLLEADGPVIASEDERKLWSRIRGLYETTTRWSSFPFIGAPFRYLVSSATEIKHLHPYRDQSRKTVATKRLRKMIDKGLGHTMVETLRETGRPLLTTYFAPAHVADAAGLDKIHCVVTDSDIHRIWAPLEPENSRIEYLAPSTRVLRRLRAYGVKKERIHVTGYPLPDELLGGRELGVLKRNLLARLTRLDPEGIFRDSYPDEIEHFLGGLESPDGAGPPHLAFAVGGAGAQTTLVAHALPSLAPLIRDGKWRLSLIAGVRPEVADLFRRLLQKHGLEDHATVLFEEDLRTYFERFNAHLADVDVLWTKPSELTFFGALGISLLLSPPVGVQEWYNRRWARESGAGLKQRDARYAAQWLTEWLEDGLLASAAWAGFMRLPKFGLYEIQRRLAGRER